ncbi:TonB-dependent receptor plug domain-containing protein [Hirschia maritima]|uniref:TonB-dependent receptor plug domain-containing protein n=1 Tax=Hirschia maritima TaxID=1121961 RepID=UPI00037AB79B|nr:TonB-dependent receptor [Hirschia maritima]
MYTPSRMPLLALLATTAFTFPVYGQEADHHDEHHEEESHEMHDDHKDDEHAEHDHEKKMDKIIVQATRSGRLLQDEPMRVEVIPREEIEEKAIMRPGNIATMVNETGGIRVQVTSPALGSSNIRIQGLYGRYTQLLADGLPLYGGQASSLGLLQIPPTDLRQVEVIKGSATSLYGASAIGGVVNLVSRRPDEEIENEILFNITSLDGQDLTTYSAIPLSDNLGVSFTAGAHRQGVKDFDDDGWIDIPSSERWTARPRLFWEGANGAEVYATLGFMTEQRNGGTLEGRTVPDGTFFAQNQDTTRVDGGLIIDFPLSNDIKGQIRSSVMAQDHEHRFGDVIEDDKHESYLIEASASGGHEGTNWAAGLAWQTESYSSITFPGFDYTYDVPGLFGQLDHDYTDKLSVSVSGRLDEHSEYGTQFSPRFSILYRPENWTFRGSVADGFYAPTPFVEEIEASGLSRLEPLSDIVEETAQTVSIDIGYKQGGIEANATFFASDVDGVTRLEEFSSVAGGDLDRVRLVNSPGKTELRGSELLLRYLWNDFKLTGSYLYIDSSEPNELGTAREEVALTPKHSAGLVAMWERHGEFRLGMEMYYTGEQRVENSPYRTRSDPYLDIGILGEITIGPASWFINAENILNVRQTKEEPLIRTVRAPDGQWTTDIWSRNDGFIVNGGVRLKF